MIENVNEMNGNELVNRIDVNELLLNEMIENVNETVNEIEDQVVNELLLNENVNEI